MWQIILFLFLHSALMFVLGYITCAVVFAISELKGENNENSN